MGIFLIKHFSRFQGIIEDVVKASHKILLLSRDQRAETYILPPLPARARLRLYYPRRFILLHGGEVPMPFVRTCGRRDQREGSIISNHRDTPISN